MSRKLLKLGAIGVSSMLAYKQVQSSKYQPKFTQFLLAEELSGGGGKKLSHGTDQCILVIGTTGTGKSSTISKCTGQSLEVSDRADSVTRKCQIFSDLNTSSRPVWIDTVGYDDTTRLDDEESFKSVLKFIQEENLLKIKAIIWTILPQERKDARLQRQAEFINRFREEEIWSNVIIVAKQPGSFSLEKSCQGAEEAAKMLSGGQGPTIQRLGFTYLDDSIPEDFRQVLQSLDPDKRRAMLYYEDEEVNAAVTQAIDNIESPIQVIFSDVKCEDCGIVGDKRLLPEFCHMEKLFKHPQPLRHFHPSELQAYHPLPVENNHPGVLRLTGGPDENCQTVKNVLVGLTPVIGLLRDTSEGVKTGLLAALAHYTCSRLETPLRFTFACCEGEESSVGCRESHSCCRRSPGSQGCLHQFPCCGGGPGAGGCLRSFPCCGRDEGVVGCLVVCKKCEEPWGSPAGNCYRRQHSLVSL